MNAIERLKELEAKATPYPWVSRIGGSGVCNKYIDVVVIDGDERDSMKRENVHLIVEMRNALPQLLAMVEAAAIMREDFEGVDWLSPGAQAYDKAKAELDEETK